MTIAPVNATIGDLAEDAATLTLACRRLACGHRRIVIAASLVARLGAEAPAEALATSGICPACGSLGATLSAPVADRPFKRRGSEREGPHSALISL